GNDEPYDATFVSARRLDDWLENVPAARHPFVLGLAPGAAPMAEVPAGYRDFLAEVGRYVGRLPAPAAVRGTDPATADGTSYRQWGSLAQDVAEHLDIRPGDRLLINTGAHEQPVTWLLAPLAARATVVLCANLDPTTLDARVVAEGVTRVL
ncbi:MAG TPA: TIGR03089 family protein, partial [Rugosimonospora sp.]|nr:TIGR03089 family protein [Rugosimonospora sp.]